MAGTAVLDPKPASGRPSTGNTVAVGLALLVAAVFWVVAAMPYLALNEQQFGQYWPRRFWMLAHIAGGTVALFIGPIQLWLGINRRRLALHRKLGLAYIAAIAVSVVAGYYLAFNSDGPLAFAMGLAGLATASVVTTGMAFAAITRRAIQQHQDWMIRSCVVTFGFVTFRAMVVVMQGLGLGTVEDQISAAAWFCWAGPLMVTEVFLQARRVFLAPASR